VQREKDLRKISRQKWRSFKRENREKRAIKGVFLKILIFFIFLYYFDMLILKIILKKYKNYFNIFLNKIYFKTSL